MKLKNLIITLVIIILLAGVGWAYWYFLMGPVTVTPSNNNGSTQQPGFQPINRPGTTGTGGTKATSTTSTTSSNGGSSTTGAKVPALRLLSDTPVGGYGASTTAATTTIRWADRGRGNIYESIMGTNNIKTISNTVVPKIVSSVWNKNLTSFVSSIFEDGDEVPTNVYVDILPQKGAAPISTTSVTLGDQIAPYSLKGRNISGDVIAVVSSPDRSQLFMLMNESGNGVGYVSSFDGKGMTKIFTTPMTQLNVEWPADGIIAITTKGSANYNGYLYFVNPKTGLWSKMLGPKIGLSTSVSHNGKYIIYSYVDTDSGFTTGLYSVANSTTTEAVITTLADKCTWGNLNKEMAYCAVPNNLGGGALPDEWYAGTVSMTDKLWQINASSGEVRIVSNIIDQSDRIIDAYNLSLDARDHYLFFMNKNDLSLWSLDLIRTR